MSPLICAANHSTWHLFNQKILTLFGTLDCVNGYLDLFGFMSTMQPMGLVYTSYIVTKDGHDWILH